MISFKLWMNELEMRTLRVIGIVKQFGVSIFIFYFIFLFLFSSLRILRVSESSGSLRIRILWSQTKVLVFLSVSHVDYILKSLRFRASVVQLRVVSVIFLMNWIWFRSFVIDWCIVVLPGNRNRVCFTGFSGMWFFLFVVCSRFRVSIYRNTTLLFRPLNFANRNLGKQKLITWDWIWGFVSYVTNLSSSASFSYWLWFDSCFQFLVSAMKKVVV